MPIRQENRALYPANWATEIRPMILLRANNACEHCHVHNRTLVFRWKSGGRHFYTYSVGATFDADSGRFCGYDLADRFLDAGAGRFVEIVLTTAHLIDPNPGNCEPTNLAALCQRCHLRLDHPMHKQNAAARRKAAKSTNDLFSGTFE